MNTKKLIKETILKLAKEKEKLNEVEVCGIRDAVNNTLTISNMDNAIFYLERVLKNISYDF